jgi:hypothetical protein
MFRLFLIAQFFANQNQAVPGTWHFFTITYHHDLFDEFEAFS